MARTRSQQPQVQFNTRSDEVAPAPHHYDPPAPVPPLEETNRPFPLVEPLESAEETLSIHRERPRDRPRQGLTRPTEQAQPEVRPQPTPPTQRLVPDYTRQDYRHYWEEENVEDIYTVSQPHVPTPQQQLRTTKAQLQQMVEVHDQLVIDNQELREQIASLREQVGSVGEKDVQIADLRTDNESLEKTGEQLRQQVADLTAVKEHLTAQLKTLSHTVMERQRREAEASEQSRLRLIRSRMRSRTRAMGVSVTRTFVRQEVFMGPKTQADQAKKATTDVASLPKARAIEAARKAGQTVEHAQLEEASRLLAKDLASGGSSELRTHLTKLYLECKNSEEQAHVVGSLLAPEYRELLGELLADPSERNLLRTRLSETERERLLAIAEIGDDVRRTEAIFSLASGSPPKPPSDPPSTTVVAPVPFGDKRPGISLDELIAALRKNDEPGVQRVVGDNVNAAVECIVAAVQLDELSYGELRKFRTKSQEVRELAERALHLLVDEGGPQSGASSPGGGQQLQPRATMPRDRESIRALLKWSGPRISAMGATYAGDPSAAPILLGQWVADKPDAKHRVAST